MRCSEETDGPLLTPARRPGSPSSLPALSWLLPLSANCPSEDQVSTALHSWELLLCGVVPGGSNPAVGGETGFSFWEVFDSGAAGVDVGL